MTQSFLLRNTRHYMSLSFIMLWHLTNGIHEICLHPCIYTFEEKKRNTGDPKTYSVTVARPPIQEQPRLVHRRRLPEAINHHGSWAGKYKPRQQLTSLQGSQTSTAHHDGPQKSLQKQDNNVRPEGLGQNTPEGENNIFRLWCSEKKVQATGWKVIHQHTRSMSPIFSFLMHPIWRVGSHRTILTPKNRATRNRIVDSNRSAPPSNHPPQQSRHKG